MRRFVEDFTPIFEQPAPHKESIPWRRTLLEVLPGLFGCILYLLGISNQHPTASKLLLVVVIGAVAIAPMRYLWRAAQWCWRKLQERRFTSTQDDRLWRLVNRFDRFASERQGRDLRSILRSVSSPVAYKFIGSYCLDGWMTNFRHELTSSSRNLEAFLRRRTEFGSLLSTFIRYFVQELQQELLKQPPLPDDIISRLEDFRTELAVFLQDVEEWSELVDEKIRELNTTVGNHPHPGQFIRVPSFNRAAAATVVGK